MRGGCDSQSSDSQNQFCRLLFAVDDTLVTWERWRILKPSTIGSRSTLGTWRWKIKTDIAIFIRIQS